MMTLTYSSTIFFQNAKVLKDDNYTIFMLSLYSYVSSSLSSIYIILYFVPVTFLSLLPNCFPGSKWSVTGWCPPFKVYNLSRV